MKNIDTENSAKSLEKFDYFVCIALNDEFSNPRYIIFTREEAMALPMEKEAYKGRITRSMEREASTIRNATKNK
jgi:hypothetical protein